MHPMVKVSMHAMFENSLSCWESCIGQVIVVRVREKEELKSDTRVYRPKTHIRLEFGIHELLFVQNNIWCNVLCHRWVQYPVPSTQNIAAWKDKGENCNIFNTRYRVIFKMKKTYHNSEECFGILTWTSIILFARNWKA